MLDYRPFFVYRGFFKVSSGCWRCRLNFGVSVGRYVHGFQSGEVIGRDDSISVAVHVNELNVQLYVLKHFGDGTEIIEVLVLRFW